ncbi:MAG: DUF5050 domain-containing protein [Clostridia bacterium]|nr:DUF5050 domain-containing protein [Clostridia bacterium]
METYALFSDGSAEVIVIKNMRVTPEEKEKGGLLYRSWIDDSDLHKYAEKSIKNTYYDLLIKFQDNTELHKTVAIYVYGFSMTVIGGSTDLAFSLAFIAHLVKNKILVLEHPVPLVVAATGILNNKMQVCAVEGIRNKIAAAVEQKVELVFYPEENDKELKTLMENDRKFHALVAGTELCPVKSLDDVYTRLKILGRNPEISPEGEMIKGVPPPVKEMEKEEPSHHHQTQTVTELIQTKSPHDKSKNMVNGPEGSIGTKEHKTPETDKVKSMKSPSGTGRGTHFKIFATNFLKWLFLFSSVTLAVLIISSTLKPGAGLPVYSPGAVQAPDTAIPGAIQSSPFISKAPEAAITDTPSPNITAKTSSTPDRSTPTHTEATSPGAITTPSSYEPTLLPIAQPTPTRVISSSTPINIRGNSLSNHINRGIASKQGEDFFFRNASGLCKAAYPSSEEPVVLTGDRAAYINVVGGYVYYIREDTGKICRIGTDGKKGEVYADLGRCSELHVLNNTLYYVKEEDGWIYKVNEDMRDSPVCLSRSKAKDINVFSNTVYFINKGKGGQLYQVKTDGTDEKPCPNPGMTAETYIVSDGCFYVLNNQRLTAISINGASAFSLEGVTCFNVAGNNLYYVRKGTLYSSQKDGSGETLIRTVGVIEELNITGNRLWYKLLGKYTFSWL